MSDWSALRINVARLSQRQNLAELKRRSTNDTSIPIDATVTAKGMEITTSRIPDGSKIVVVGSADTTLSGIEVRAKVTSTWEGECRRCLDPVIESVELDLNAPFLPAHKASEDADAYAIDGDVVDVGEVVREELMLALPLTPLCREDCDGADPERFPTTAPVDEDEAEEDDEPAMDPRWAALSGLTFDEDLEEPDTL